MLRLKNVVKTYAESTEGAVEALKLLTILSLPFGCLLSLRRKRQFNS